jgi:hypothetical protein
MIWKPISSEQKADSYLAKIDSLLSVFLFKEQIYNKKQNTNKKNKKNVTGI